MAFPRTKPPAAAQRARHAGERGSMVTYILIAIFLVGILTLTLSEGPKKSAMTQQLDGMTMAIKGDLDTIEASINDCVLLYPTAIDLNNDGTTNTTDNANVPFPVIYASGSYSTNGALANAVCPGMPPTPLTGNPTVKQQIIGISAGRTLRMLGDTATYTTTLANDSTEGVMIKIVPTAANATWTEAAQRINSRYSTCKAAVDTTSLPCANTCLYFWIKRLPTSTTAVEAGCP